MSVQEKLASAFNTSTNFTAANFTDISNETELDTEYVGYPDYPEEIFEQFLYSRLDTVLVTIIMPIIFVIGIVGNTLVIFVFARNPAIQTVTNLFLVNLAIADLLFLSFSVTTKIIIYYAVPTPLLSDFSAVGVVGCKLINYISQMTLVSSTFTIILLAFEKYLAVAWPVGFLAARSKPRAVAVCLFMWFFAALYSLPEGYFRTIVVYKMIWPKSWTNNTLLPDEIQMCQAKDGESVLSFNYDTYFRFDQYMFISVIPVLLILYILTFLKLENRGGSSSRTSVRAKKQVVRMLLATTVAYVICITPFRITSLLLLEPDFLRPPKSLSILVNSCFILMYINSVVNPIIYNALNETYRKAFRKSLVCSFLPNQRSASQRMLTATPGTGNLNNVHTNNNNGLNSNNGQANLSTFTTHVSMNGRTIIESGESPDQSSKLSRV